MRDPAAILSLAVFVAIVCACALAPVYARDVARTGPNDVHVADTVRVSGREVPVVKPASFATRGNRLIAYRPPEVIGPTLWHAGGRFVLGADQLGRDIAVRLLYGGVFTLEVGFAATAVSVVLALALALLAGYHGGWADWLITRLLDLVWATPPLLVVIGLGAALELSGFHHFGISLGPNSIVLPIVAIGVLRVPYAARPLRGRVLQLVRREFVDAARLNGARAGRIMLREIAPSLTADLISFTTLLFAGNVLLVASINFLGVYIGNTPPSPSWGGMIADGNYSSTGVALVLTVVSLNFFGDRVRDVLDPHGQRRRLSPTARAWRSE